MQTRSVEGAIHVKKFCSSEEDRNIFYSLYYIFVMMTEIEEYEEKYEQRCEEFLEEMRNTNFPSEKDAMINRFFEKFSITREKNQNSFKEYFNLKKKYFEMTDFNYINGNTKNTQHSETVNLSLLIQTINTLKEKYNNANR